MLMVHSSQQKFVAKKPKFWQERKDKNLVRIHEISDGNVQYKQYNKYTLCERKF